MSILWKSKLGLETSVPSPPHYFAPLTTSAVPRAGQKESYHKVVHLLGKIWLYVSDMSISANAVDFFKFLGISQEEMQDIRAIFGKTKPTPNKEAVVTILNKFLGKANDVILRDGVWILEDKVIGNQDQTIRVYPVTPAKDTGTNTGAKTDLEDSFKVPL